MAQTVEKRFLSQSAFGIGFTHDMIDTSVGGHMGFSADHRYWVNSANYIPRPLIPIVIQGPRFYQYMNDSAKRLEIFRSVMENHPITIEGINGKLNVARDSSPYGASGEIQEEVVNVTREPSTPTFTWFDKQGRAISTIWEDYIRNALMEEETKVAGVHMQSGNGPEDHLADLYAFTMLFIEPDPTHRKVVKAALCTNMFPGDGPDWTMRMDKTSNMQLQQITIPFTAITQHGTGVRRVAQSILDGISIKGANPHHRAAFISEIAPDVMSAASGYKHQVEQVRSDSVALG